MTSEVETIRRDATALEAALTMLCRGVNRRGFGCVFAALGSSVQVQTRIDKTYTGRGALKANLAN